MKVNVFDILIKVALLLPALARLVGAVLAAVDADGPGGKKIKPEELAELVTVEVGQFIKAVVEVLRPKA